MRIILRNQLMKPLQQLFGLALEQIYELQRKSGALKNVRKEYDKYAKEETQFGIAYEKTGKIQFGENQNAIV